MNEDKCQGQRRNREGNRGSGVMAVLRTDIKVDEHEEGRRRVEI